MNGERLVAAALAALLALTAWMVWRIGDATREAAPTAETRTASVAGADPPAAASSRVPPDAAAQAPSADELVVCGVGTVRARHRDDALAQGWQRIAERHADAARDALMLGLAMSGDERQRAAATIWSAAQASRAAAARSAARHGLDRDRCAEVPACRESARADGDEAADTHVRALARSAASTRDPHVYAFALGLCRARASAESATSAASAASAECAMLSTAQWARLDPDNAAPWLAAAREAAERRDDAAYAEAIHRAAGARVLDDGLGALFGVLGQPWIEALPAGVRAAVTAQWLEVALGFPLDVPGHAPAWCRDGAADANRRQSCEGLAALFLERSTSMVHLAVGRSIGRALGWSDERLTALQQQHDGLHAIASDTQDAADPLSCERLDELRHRVAAREHLGGEVGSVRDAARRSGLDSDALAARGRAWRDDRAAATQAAASAAGAR